MSTCGRAHRANIQLLREPLDHLFWVGTESDYIGHTPLHVITSAVRPRIHATRSPSMRCSGAPLFAFVSIAHSTTCAAMQGRAPVGRARSAGLYWPERSDLDDYHAAVDEGFAATVPTSSLNEIGEESEEGVVGEERGDE